MTLQFWVIYCTTLFLASIIPGPSMLLALNHGMRFGAKRTVATACGNVVASLIQASISIAGLGALLIASEKLFLAIKWLGAAYLIFIGIQTLRSSGTMIQYKSTCEGTEKKPLYKMFGESFFISMGNPKAIIFFSALFPQFISLKDINHLELFAAMIVVGLSTFIAFMIYAFGGEQIITIFKKSYFGKWFNRIIGGTFISSGIGILVKR